MGRPPARFSKGKRLCSQGNVSVVSSMNLTTIGKFIHFWPDATILNKLVNIALSTRHDIIFVALAFRILELEMNRNPNPVRILFCDYPGGR